MGELTASSHPFIIGDYSVDKFLRENWQKKALFLPGALPDFRSPLSPDELAGLALESEVESRLVEDTAFPVPDGLRSPWTQREGPFNESDLTSLSEENWTLLVQDVDKFVPDVAELLALVAFLPRWSIDDIMVSLAARGGSVGPHTDQYDVFLVQAQGTRRWQLSTNVDDSRLRKDTSLKVLENFDAEVTYEANPGDVLYLPPGVGHFGIAQDECLTYSFGFRSPSASSLLGAFADSLIGQTRSSQLREPLSEARRHPAEISPALLAKVQSLIEEALEKKGSVASWLGPYLTEVKTNLDPDLPEREFSSVEILEALAQGKFLSRALKSSFLFACEGDPKAPDGATTLFVDGIAYSLEEFSSSKNLAALLSESPTLNSQALAPWLGPSAQKVLGTLLAALVNTGALKLSD